MSIEKIIENYTPSDRAIEAVRSTKIALLVGISGAGKDTIKKELLKRPEFGDIVSHTTRAPRENGGVLEKDGVDYHFVNDDDVKSLIADGEFVEVKLVHGTVYGTSVSGLTSAGARGIATTDIDVQGVSEYRAISDKVIAIFVIPPSYDEWLRRLQWRYTTHEEFLREWPKRRQSAIQELEKALELPYYHCIVNDDLDRAVNVAAEIAARNDVFTRKDDEARIAARDLLNKIKG